MLTGDAHAASLEGELRIALLPDFKNSMALGYQSEAYTVVYRKTGLAKGQGEGTEQPSHLRRSGSAGKTSVILRFSVVSTRRRIEFDGSELCRKLWTNW